MAEMPIHIDDCDNEDFDWEAAVREIDHACMGAGASTSNHQGFCSAHPAESSTRARPNPGVTSRQTTLDRFVDSYTKNKRDVDRCPKKPTPEPPAVGGADRDDFGRGDGDAGVCIDFEAAKTWIYPINIPLRDYQFAIAKTALFSNTLVALPTGLGKTLIAAVVMYNYFRWFPGGKIVFAAPSRPLVMQQIEACHNIVGIPQEWTIDMTGQMIPLKRSGSWKEKRVFFVTPQVLEKDIQSGICMVKELVCLVIDEAHRALGNYSYCVAVRELMSVPVQLRILALTATPGSKQRTVQNVIDNLCISTLEYRNESDRDVSPYVHNRTLELIEVAMAKDAIGINSLFLEAIQPFVSRLCSIGVLYIRDLATLSPWELLNSRDTFRQAPPQGLPHAKYGEVEGYFGVLITLYHIRKLLSSHGIRPAYEMLEEKLQQGSFARLISRNESIQRAKLLMQRSLSHGAPNPKLVKMIEILTEHFKTKDPKDSRVIIFSNFRGSVRDIMDSLSNIADLVKATEFIGQSSGKKLKGQSQKAQQAVLQKFRSGGYNVIVATSIGEEGLDIMEVDLVICFDANISPLRMIQRMGRTGRKHDGRVVVLACEGSELKGYLKKQASGKAVKKHLHNGGVSSFDFHPSPRMVPHTCKPQVEFVEMSIEQYVPRGEAAKHDVAHRSPFSRKITDEAKDLIARYFHPSKKDTWKPSLIAFPTFQAFPSAVYKVSHSFRTTSMLIDAMQCLQGLSFSKAENSPPIEVEGTNHSLEAPTPEHDNEEQDLAGVHFVVHKDIEVVHRVKVSGVEASFRDRSVGRESLDILEHPIKVSNHCFFFGEGAVTVNAAGRVLIGYVPTLPNKVSLASKGTINNETLQPNSRNDSRSLEASAVHDVMLTEHPKDIAEATVSNDFKYVGDKEILAAKFPKYGVNEERKLFQTSSSQQKSPLLEDSVVEIPGNTKYVVPDCLEFESRGTLKDTALSPRLTHFIKEGVVPESPMVKINQYTSNLECECSKSKCDLHGVWTKCPSGNVAEKTIDDASCPLNTPRENGSIMAYIVTPKITKFSGFSLEYTDQEKSESDKVQVSAGEHGNRGNMLSSSINKSVQTPLANPVNSSSEEWQLNSIEASKSFQQSPKYKRLRRHKDMIKNLPLQTSEDKFNLSMEKASGPESSSILNERRFNKGNKEEGERNVSTFIEVEAEVSEDAGVSEDEEDEVEDENDDSFIDDGINPTEASTQAANTRADMMTVYRRSLLTQSPGENLLNCATISHESISSRTAESGSCSSPKICSSLQTPGAGLQSAVHSTCRNPVPCQLDSERASLRNVPGETSSIQRNCSNKIESRKRKLSFQNATSGPATSDQSKHNFPFEQAGKASLDNQLDKTEIDAHLIFDDEFFQGLDLDAVEAQATTFLQCKSQIPVGRMQMTAPNHNPETNGDPSMKFSSPPSFDLGI